MDGAEDSRSPVAGAGGRPPARGTNLSLAATAPTARPAAVTALAVQDLLLALIAVTPALALAMLPASRPIGIPFLLGSGAAALCAAACLAAAVGLLQLEEYGRRLQIAIASIGLVVLPIGTLLGAFCIAYLVRPEIRLLFAGGRMTPRDAALRQHRGRGQEAVLACALAGIGASALALLFLGVVLAAVAARWHVSAGSR